MSQRWNDGKWAGVLILGGLLATALGAGPAEDFFPAGHPAEGL